MNKNLTIFSVYLDFSKKKKRNAEPWEERKWYKEKYQLPKRSKSKEQKPIKN